MLKGVSSVFVLILGAAFFGSAVISSQPGLASRAAAGPVQAPPNEAAQLSLDGGRVQLRYHDTLVFDGRVTNPSALRAIRPSTSKTGDRVDQVLAFFASGSEPIELSGTITASGEAFACEADRPLRGRPIVRHVSGDGSSLLDHAVYDRHADWVLSGGRPAAHPDAGDDGRGDAQLAGWCSHLHPRGARRRDPPPLPASLLPAAPGPAVLRAVDLPLVAEARRRLVLVVCFLRQGHRAGREARR